MKNNYRLKINVTNFKVYGLDKFEVVKSKYDGESKHFDFELKFDGPRFEGSYYIQNNASDSRFDVDFDGYLNYKVQVHPGTLKLGWTFGTNETTHKLSVNDVKFAVAPLDDSKGSIFDKLGDEVPAIKDSSKDLNALRTELKQALNEVRIEILQSTLQEYVEKYESVENMTESLYKYFDEVLEFFEPLLDCKH